MQSDTLFRLDAADASRAARSHVKYMVDVLWALCPGQTDARASVRLSSSGAIVLRHTTGHTVRGHCANFKGTLEIMLCTAGNIKCIISKHHFFLTIGTYCYRITELQARVGFSANRNEYKRGWIQDQFAWLCHTHFLWKRVWLCTDRWVELTAWVWPNQSMQVRNIQEGDVTRCAPLL